MTAQIYKRIDKKQKCINKIKSKRVTLYEDYTRKDNSLGKREENLEEDLRIYKVQAYNDSELRNDIITEAIENNYPLDNLKDLQLYNEEKTWDINVPDVILEKYQSLELYNEQSKKRKGFLKRISQKIYVIFFQGGAN